MTDPDAGPLHRRAAPRLTPERVRSLDFSRTPIGRRGLDEDEVERFLHRVAEEVAARDAAEASLRAEASFYKEKLLEWQTDQRDDGLLAPAAAPNVEAVNILSRAQQEADAYVAQTQEYCRRLAADARSHADDILNEAHARTDAAAAHATRQQPARLGDEPGADIEGLERRLAWARTFLSSLEAAETQLRATREALSYEFGKLDSETEVPSPY